MGLGVIRSMVHRKIGGVFVSVELKSTNPMILLHGAGPSGVMCRHCDHLDPGKVKGNAHCKRAAEHTTGPEWKQYRKGGHRLMWAPCSLFSGETSYTYVCSGPCGKEHTISLIAKGARRFTGWCKACGEISGKAKRDKAKKSLVLPEFNGCHPVKTFREGNRCPQECENRPLCLNYTAKRDWPGFKASKKEGGYDSVRQSKTYHH